MPENLGSFLDQQDVPTLRKLQSFFDADATRCQSESDADPLAAMFAAYVGRLMGAFADSIDTTVNNHIEFKRSL